MKLIECPRDAMQGLHDYLSVEDKVRYINAILKVGFDTIDAGSFVSPKAIPQLKDTAEVLSNLDMSSTRSKLLVIAANKRGAEEAVKFDEVAYLGFPFSISETFQKRNINSSIEDSLRRLDNVQNLCVKSNKKLVTYFSMAFGNPYGDEWSPEIVANWVGKLIQESGVNILSLSDTIGTSNPDSIKWLFDYVIPNFPEVEIGAHLHTTPDTWKEKISAAVESGCKRFDGAIKGFGGCPMAADGLTGNMATENIISYLKENNIEHGLDEKAFSEALRMSLEIFPN
ncbi:MAG: hydroxymethylglutaryl-CoA lyase [Flavobacteriales bacterium]|nr:hydroxymethylglutaryl-CoA lyase [Flavobacteriales bacterium]